MSLDAIATKRLRRAWEPTEKAWEDHALDMPWEDLNPSLRKETIFSLKNVFFFSHATSVQTAAVKQLTAAGTSTIMEAPTGSGKTLAFLIPLLERTLLRCEEMVKKNGRPPLSRHILGVIFSPSRVLAQQSFIVARNFAARLPYNIQFHLCDGALESPANVLRRLEEVARGAGIFLVTTPLDFCEFLEAYNTMNNCPCAKKDSENKKEGEKKKEEEVEPIIKRSRVEREVNKVKESQEDRVVRFFSSEEQRFVLIIDEADMIYRSTDMKRAVCDFVDRFGCQVDTSITGQQKEKGKKASKMAKNAEGKAEMQKKEKKEGLLMDLFFIGATVATSDEVTEYARTICPKMGSQLLPITEGAGENFVSQLQNKYAVCNAYDFLPYLIQMINSHPSKKHFVFFNKRETLLFAQKLFITLSKLERPLLFIDKLFSMYEGQGDSTRLSQYNGFLTHICGASNNKAKRRHPEGAELKNQHFLGGWKRDGKPSMGNGAILLCTDIAAFGLDVRDVDYVYHFEPPTSVQSYIHRIGRVGRMGMRGSSILLLPCLVEDTTLCQSRERKVTSNRFNTVTNTNSNTSGMQFPKITANALDSEKKNYVDELSKLSSLEECAVPPFAPISSTLRKIISADDKLTKLAKSAAMAMCSKGAEDGQESWYKPALAVKSLLLD